MDWAHFGKIQIGQATRTLWAFVMVLSWSRAIFLRFYISAAMSSFLRGHVDAFAAFAGVPRVLLYDNLKSAVLERAGQAIVFNPTLLELCAHYRYEPRPVAVARGNEKGRVERAIRYVRDNFFAARSWSSLDDLNEQAHAWTHGPALERKWRDDRTRSEQHFGLGERVSVANRASGQRGARVREHCGMALSTSTFETSPRNPVPTVREMQALAAYGSKKTIADRAELMEAICAVLNIPRGGWSTGISRLCSQGDIRLVWLLRRLAHAHTASAVVKNLENARRFVGGETMLALVVAARESADSIDAVSMQPIDSWRQGGLDFLWDEKDKLGLPSSITSNWQPVPPFISGETHREVHPAYIPARDQVIAYAAQINTSFNRAMDTFLQRLPSGETPAWTGCRVATLVWKAYAFLAPGGRPFDSKRSLSSQLGQGFGCLTALTYLANSAPLRTPRRLDSVLTDMDFNRSEWVRIAKVRAAEALYLERLLYSTREFILPGF